MPRIYITPFEHVEELIRSHTREQTTGRLDLSLGLMCQLDQATMTVLSTVRLHGILVQEYSNQEDVEQLLSMFRLMYGNVLRDAQRQNWLGITVKAKISGQHLWGRQEKCYVWQSEKYDLSTVLEWNDL